MEFRSSFSDRKSKVFVVAALKVQTKVIAFLLLMIYFFNLETKEYLYYVVKVYPEPPLEQPPKELVGNVGAVSAHPLMVHNPFTEAVQFELVSPVPELTAVEVLVEPISEGKMMVEYSPGILEPEKPVKCKLLAPPFEDEIITFILKPKPSQPSPAILVDAYLGSSAAFTTKVKNRSKLRVNYDILTSDELSVRETEIELAPNQDCELRAVYEPINLGTKQLEIKLHSSSEDRTMFYHVFGTCHPPKPLGPIEVQVGSFETIAFKNVFKDEAEFELTTSDPTFGVYLMDGNESTLSMPGHFSLGSKETALIVVELKMQEVSDNHRLIDQFPIAGKLSIEMNHWESGSGGPEPLLKWEYYIKGVLRPDELKAVGSNK